MKLPIYLRALSLAALIPINGLAQPLAMSQQKALGIRSHLEQQLYTLPLEQQGESALMLYRSTGNKTYLNTARVSLYLSADRLQKLEGSMKNSNTRKALLLSENLPVTSVLLDKYPDYFFFAFLVLPELYRINQFAMTVKGSVGRNLDRAISGFNFRRGLTAPDLLKNHGPQLAEHVYALLNLDYGDFRQEFNKAFQSTFPNSGEKKMPAEQLRIKWLTMTHLILAASDQLQTPVNDPLLKWIPTYFQKNESLILRDGDEVLLAKVGLALLVTGHEDSRLLKKIKGRLSQRPSSGTVKKTEFWIMLLLGWVKEYYPDPALYQMINFKNKTPYILKPTGQTDKAKR